MVISVFAPFIFLPYGIRGNEHRNQNLLDSFDGFAVTITNAQKTKRNT